VAETARHHQLCRWQGVSRAGGFRDGDLAVVLIVDQQHRQVELAGDVADVEVRRRPADTIFDRGNESRSAALGKPDTAGEAAQFAMEGRWRRYERHAAGATMMGDRE